jgi:hypothetical protein
LAERDVLRTAQQDTVLATYRSIRPS